MAKAFRRAKKAALRRSRVARISSQIMFAVQRDMATNEPDSLTVFRGRRRALTIQFAPGMGALVAAALSPEGSSS